MVYKYCHVSVPLKFELTKSHKTEGTYGTVNVVAVGGADNVHPVFLHEDVKVTNMLFRSAVEANGIANWVDNKER